MDTGVYIPKRAKDNFPLRTKEKKAVDVLLKSLLEKEGSDLFLKVDEYAYMQIMGETLPQKEWDKYNLEEIVIMLREMVSDTQWAYFEKNRELSASYEIEGVARFRLNYIYAQGKPSASIRAIPNHIKSLDELGMPEVIKSFASLPRGLVLITGPTGSGKTTTLAGIINEANKTRPANVITIEDPIEFVFKSEYCFFRQREVGKDTRNFPTALRSALRDAPDIILVGELRDRETIQTALVAAETGHLVLGTLHTSSAKSTVNRILDMYPADQIEQVRASLSASLSAVVCQSLCQSLGEKARVAALEIMKVNSSVRTSLRTKEGLVGLDNTISQTRDIGNQLLDDHLKRLLDTAQISAEEAYFRANDKSRFPLER
jgi:twitching motility protein PilT